MLIEEIISFVWHIVSTYTLYVALCVFGVMVLLAVLAFISHYAGAYDDTDRNFK